MFLHWQLVIEIQSGAIYFKIMVIFEFWHWALYNCSADSQWRRICVLNYSEMFGCLKCFWLEISQTNVILFCFIFINVIWDKRKWKWNWFKRFQPKKQMLSFMFNLLVHHINSLKVCHNTLKTQTSFSGQGKVVFLNSFWVIYEPW